MSDESLHAVKKTHTEVLVVASKEIGLEVNADKTMYVVMSGNQNAGRSHSMKTVNSSFERVEDFKYLGTTLTNQNAIQEEMKSRFKSGNACYYSVQNLLSSDVKLKFYRLSYNSVALVRERTIPTERPPPVGEVSANFCG
jgi:hypothetical protein